MDSLIKENTRLVELLRKVHQVSVEAYTDILHLNSRVKNLEEENTKILTENNQLKNQLQLIDDRQAALENISKAIKVAVSEFQKLKDQYNLEVQKREHAEEIVEILETKIEKLEKIIKANQTSTAPSLNNPYLKESTQLRNELLGVHRELRESIKQYEQVKTQLGKSKEHQQYSNGERIGSNVSFRTQNTYKEEKNSDNESETNRTFLTSVASPVSHSDIANARLTQLKSLVGEMDATLLSTQKPLYKRRESSSQISTVSSIPVFQLDANSNVPFATESSGTIQSKKSEPFRRPSYQYNSQTVVRRPSVTEIKTRPISPPKDGKFIQRISKFDEYFDQLQDELLALGSPSEQKP
eukprot:NODE_35_length_36362_cov_0.944434.p10 type:complete len:354 gc:universal NODE_35_length_36362_cov_0.944434:30230-31291(+)